MVWKLHFDAELIRRKTERVFEGSAVRWKMLNFTVKWEFQTRAWHAIECFICLDSVLQVWRRLHHHPPPVGQQFQPRPLSCQRLHEEFFSQHRADGAPRERSAVPAALAHFLPGSCLWRTGQQLRGAGHRRLLRFTDHPRPGEDDEGYTALSKGLLYLSCMEPPFTSLLSGSYFPECSSVLLIWFKCGWQLKQ